MTYPPQEYWNNLPLEYRVTVLDEWAKNSGEIGFDMSDVVNEEWHESQVGQDYYKVTKDFEYAASVFKDLSERADDYTLEVYDMTMTPRELLDDYMAMLNNLEEDLRKLEPRHLESFISTYPELSD